MPEYHFNGDSLAIVEPKRMSFYERVLGAEKEKQPTPYDLALAHAQGNSYWRLTNRVEMR